MVWVVSGITLAVAGTAVALTAIDRMRRDRSNGAHGLLAGVGVSLALWGGVLFAVGLFVMI